MKKILSTILALALLIVGGFGVANADVTQTFWNQTSPNVLMTNTGNGLANAEIHVGACYIGTGTGTPCGGGGGAGVELGGSQTGFTNGMVQYIDQSGLQGGDTLFTRNSTTKNTILKKAVNANLTQGFEIGTPLLGLNGSFITGVDTSTTKSAYVGTVDLSGFGQSSTTAMLAAYDGTTTQTASINTDEFRASIAAAGNTAVGQLIAKKTEIDANFQTSAGLRSRFFGNGTEAYMRHQGLTDDFRVGADTGIYFYKNGSKMYFPSTVTAPGSGYVITSTAAGTSSWQLPTASLTQDYIGFGNGSNQLTGLSAFKYVNSNNQFLQTIPNNTGNAGATTSPLAFGAASYSGTGVNDLTLSWSSATYGSNKYGGNLSISISSLATPDKFSWTFTGSYGQVIGSDTDVAILPGLAQELFDTNGNLIAEITFAAGTGHDLSDTWTATTSLGTYTWGQLLTDGSHNFMYARPVIGQYYGGDAQYLTPLGGNGNRYEISDSTGEWNIFTSKLFKVKTPGGGDTLLEVDTINNTTTIGDAAGSLSGAKATMNVATGFFSIDSSLRLNVTSTSSATYNVTINDYIIATDSTSNAITVNLPASPTTGDTYVIKDATGQAGTNNVTISGNGHNIDASSSQTISTNYSSITVVFTGTIWSII